MDDGRDRLLELFRVWDQAGTSISPAEMRKSLGRLELSSWDVADLVSFSDMAYQRISIARSTHYEALILCWQSGQRSPIHDHRGSTCGVYVVEGTATETRFIPSPCGRLVPAQSRSLGAGSTCVSSDADIHQMANLAPAGQDLITLHLYSPPLTGMRSYSIADTTLADHDCLAVLRPDVLMVSLRADRAHGGIPSPNHPSRSRKPTP